MSIKEIITQVHKYYVNDPSMEILDIRKYETNWRVAYSVKQLVYYTQYTPKDIEGWLNAIRTNKLERIINE